MTVKDRIDIFIEHQGIKRSVFEKACGLSNAYTRNLKGSPSVSKVEDILKAYPELNRVWLLSGEGEMLKNNNCATAIGDSANAQNGDGNTNGNNSTQVVGDNNAVGGSALEMALSEIAEHRKLVAKAQEQIDRLISIIEKQSK